jgi:hypothetical protein
MNGTAKIEIDYDLVDNIAKEVFDSFYLFKTRMSYEKIKIDTFSVKTAVVSFLKDLNRYSFYHDSPDPNSSKLAGYLAYWLVKIKPVTSTEIEQPAFQINSKYLAANEEFAVFHALNMLGIKASHLPDKKFLGRLVYALYYRDIASKALVLIMEGLYNSVPPSLRPRQAG